MRAALVALVSALLLAACTPAIVDKSGGSGPVITLRLATSDQPGGPQASALEHFAAAVADQSGDRLRVQTIYAASGDDEAKFDQAVARQVQDGTFDLGIVPARSWDDLGVDGMRALQTPFLLDSDDLVDRVVDGDLAQTLLERTRGHRSPWPRPLAGDAPPSCRVRHTLAHPG